jgi:SAM-dependent methyltransferase
MLGEMSSSAWYDAFAASMNVRFTEEDFRAHLAAAEADLARFGHHLSPGARLLDLGCGVGCMSVPLSTLGFSVVGLDNDPRVVAAARENAARFGGGIRIVEGDVFDLDRLFEGDAFEACVSGGLLEHFTIEKIRTLADLMLGVAPLVIATMPVLSPRTLAHYGLRDATDTAFPDGIHRNLWSERDWLDGVLHGCEVVESGVSPMGADDRGPDEMFVVLRRPDRA